jgi:transcriptional regulator with XRE-family HTH domain
MLCMQSSKRARGKHRTAEQRQQILKDYQGSGLTQREFALRAGVSLSALQRWLKKSGPDQGFIQLPNVSSACGLSAPYRLHLGGGRLLEIHSGFRAEELALLLGLLREI